MSVFGKHSSCRQGIYDLKVWPKDEASKAVEASGKRDKELSISRLNKVSQVYSNVSLKVNFVLFFYSKLKKRYYKGHMVKIDWLDRLTFAQIERITKQEKKESNHMYLSIEFPVVFIDNLDYAVIYFEKGAEENCHLTFDSDVVTLPDPELLWDNLVEDKHHKLYRSDRSGITDRDNKPNAQTRNLLNQIVDYPPTKVLSSDEQDLLWKYRFYLMNQKKALTKFLKCVNWDSETEAKQATDLLPSWQPIDIEDALELLSSQFQCPTVRRYAVSRLHEAPDEVRVSLK